MVAFAAAVVDSEHAALSNRMSRVVADITEIARMYCGLPLSFRIERMLDSEHFREVAELRRAAYGRIYSNFVQGPVPDAWDTCPSAVVIMARCARTRRLLGTIRVRHSWSGREAGVFEDEAFPDSLFQEGRFLTVERFAIDAPRPQRRSVRLALFATVIELARRWGADFLTLYTRMEIEAIYERIGFRRVPGPPRMFSGPLTNGVPQVFMRVDTRVALSRTKAPFARFLVRRLVKGIPLETLAPSNMGGPRFVSREVNFGTASCWGVCRIADVTFDN